MLDNLIGPAFLIALGLTFTAYGVRQFAKAYRIASFDAWMLTVLPAAGAVVLGVLFVWSGYWLSSGA